MNKVFLKASLLPAGWQRYKLGEIADIVIGGTPARNKPEFWDIYRTSDNPWVSIADMRQSVINTTKEQITNLGVRNSNAKLISSGTVLMSFKLTIGRVARAGTNLYTNEAIAALLPRDKSIDNDFLEQGLQSWNLLQDVDQAIKGVTLNKAKLKRIEFVAPVDQTEQAKIAKVLGTCDKAIEQTEAIIAKYERIKHGLMQDLLTKGIDENGNIRSDKTHKFKNSPLGRIPVEWETMPFGELSKYVGSGITPRGGFSVYTSEGILFLRSQNVHFGGLRLDDVAYIPDHIHKRMKRSTIMEHDVLLNITGASIGRCTVVPTDLGIANVNQHVCAIRLINTSEQDSIFLATFIESWMGQQQIDRLNAGSNREGLNYEQVKAMRTMWPPEPERKLIAQHINTTIDAITSEKRYLSKLHRIKRGLMQDLLSGNVRVTPLMQKV